MNTEINPSPEYPPHPEPTRENNLIGGPGRAIRAKPVPAVEMSSDNKTAVLLAILNQNREEIRFWHEKMFQASFTLDSALMVVAAFALRENIHGRAMLGVAAAACALFAIFHSIVERVGTGAIRINGRDLEFMQAALRLNEPGDYVKTDPIYAWTGTEWLPQRHFRFLRMLNLTLALGLIVILLWRAFV